MAPIQISYDLIWGHLLNESLAPQDHFLLVYGLAYLATIKSLLNIFSSYFYGLAQTIKLSNRGDA